MNLDRTFCTARNFVIIVSSASSQVTLTSLPFLRSSDNRAVLGVQRVVLGESLGQSLPKWLVVRMPRTLTRAPSFTPMNIPHPTEQYPQW